MQTGKQIKHKNTQPNQFGSGVMGVIKIGGMDALGTGKKQAA